MTCLIIGCALTPAQDSAHSSNASNFSLDEPCRWSDECAAGLLCGREGFCEKPPHAVCSNYRLEPVQEVQPDEPASVPEAAWTSAEADAYVDKATQAVAWHPGVEGVPGNKPSVLQQAIATAREEHAQFEQVATDPASSAIAMGVYAQIQTNKRSARNFLQSTQHLFTPLPSDTPVPSNLYYCQRVWHSQLLVPAQAYTDSFGLADWQYCISSVQELLAQLGMLEGVGTHMPLAALEQTVTRASQALTSAEPMEDVPCDQYARIVELPFAAAHYGELVTADAQNTSTLDPLSDMDVDYLLDGRPHKKSFGDAAQHFLDRYNRTTEQDKPNLLGLWHQVVVLALSKSEEHLTTLERTRFSGEDIKDLVQITLLSEQFLTENPEFADLHQRVIRKIESDQRRLVLGNLGLGAGCAAATGAIALGFSTGVGAPFAMLAALGLCGGELALAYHSASKVSHLYRLALTFRHYGILSSLETHERVHALARQRTLEWATFWLTAVAAMADFAAVARAAYLSFVDFDTFFRNFEVGELLPAVDQDAIMMQWRLGQLQRQMQQIIGESDLAQSIQRIQTILGELQAHRGTFEQWIAPLLDPGLRDQARLLRKAAGQAGRELRSLSRLTTELAVTVHQLGDNLADELSEIFPLVREHQDVLHFYWRQQGITALPNEFDTWGSFLGPPSFLDVPTGDGTLASVVPRLEAVMRWMPKTRVKIWGPELGFTPELEMHVWRYDVGTDPVSPYFIAQSGGYWNGKGVHTLEAVQALRDRFGYPMELTDYDPATGVMHIRVHRWYNGGSQSMTAEVTKAIYPHVGKSELAGAVSQGFAKALLTPGAVDFEQRLARIVVQLDSGDGLISIPAEVRFNVVGDTYEFTTHYPLLTENAMHLDQPLPLFETSTNPFSN